MPQKYLVALILITGLVSATDVAIGTVSNLDGELLIFTCKDEICLQKHEVELGRDVNVLISENMDSDNKTELIVGTSNKVDSPELVIYECNEECTVKVSAEIGFDVTAIAVGDVDNDGDIEIVVGTPKRTNADELLIFDCNNDVCKLEKTIDFEQDINTIAIDDTDRDGKNELIVGATKRIDKDELFFFDCTGATCTKKSSVFHNIDIEAVATGELNGDGKIDVITGTDQKIDLPEILVYGCNDKCKRVSEMKMGFDVKSMLARDVDNDGVDEIVAGMRNNVEKDELYVFSCATGVCELESSAEISDNIDALAYDASEGLIFTGTKLRLNDGEVKAFSCNGITCSQVYEINIDQKVIALAVGDFGQPKEVEAEVIPKTVVETPQKDFPEVPVENKSVAELEKEPTTTKEPAPVKTVNEKTKELGNVKVTKKINYDIKGSIIAILVMAALIAFVLPKLKKR